MKRRCNRVAFAGLARCQQRDPERRPSAPHQVGEAAAHQRAARAVAVACQDPAPRAGVAVPVAQQVDQPVSDAAAQAVRRMVIHRRLVTVLSMAAVAVTALWGALWSVVHPYGF